MHDKIIRQIRNNNLNGMQYDFVVAQLCVLNNKPYAEVKQLVDELVELKELDLNSQSELVIGLVDKKYYNEEYNFNKKNRHSKKQNLLKLEGKIQGTKGPFGFFIPFDSEYQDAYVHESNLLGALNGDTVLVEIKKGKKGLEGRVLQIIERANERVVGKIEFFGSHAFVKPDDVKFGKDVYIDSIKGIDVNNGDKVVVKIIKYPADKKNPMGIVVEVLGAPNKIETEVLSLIRSYNLYETFPEKVIKAADSAPQTVDRSKYLNRLDLTNEVLFTIDGADARDLDDAVSLTYNKMGQRVLGVHIADVGEYVKMGNIIDNEAFKRGTSVYFPSMVLPMLPQSLSNGICSLNEKVDRLALSVFITFDAQANVLDYKFYESIINSKKRFTYTEVDAILNDDENALIVNAQFVDTVKAMNELSKQLIKFRDKRGAIDFDLPEVAVSLNDLGDVLHIEKRQRNDSHKLIESFMIAANEAVAEFFNKNKTPFVYRIHEKPDLEKMNNFIEFVKGFGITPQFRAENVVPMDIQKIIESIEDEDIKYVVSKVCLRSLKKAKYHPVCLGHFGLASTDYCHFTSPIRRYPDLTIHRIIKQYLRNTLSGGMITSLNHFVSTSSQVSSQREVVAERAERDVDDLYRVFYMTHHLGEEFDGRISSVMEFGLFVELENTVEGLLRLEDLPADSYSYNEIQHALIGNSHTYKIGDKIKVKSIRADITNREVDFMLV